MRKAASEVSRFCSVIIFLALILNLYKFNIYTYICNFFYIYTYTHEGILKMQLIEVVDFTAAKAVTIIIHIHVRRDTHDTQERT